MGRSRWQELAPFLSVLMLVATLFSLVLLKVEVRRMGYSVLKYGQEYKKLKDQRRLMAMEFARLRRPDLVRKFAVNRLKLNDSRTGQIIQLAGPTLALPQ